MRNRSRRSSLELRGPKNASNVARKAPERCILRNCSRRFRIRRRARGSMGVRSCENREVASPDPRSANRQSAKFLATG
eukprot:3482514-Alexandrium_andersonii.AAC.1